MSSTYPRFMSIIIAVIAVFYIVCAIREFMGVERDGRLKRIYGWSNVISAIACGLATIGYMSLLIFACAVLVIVGFVTHKLVQKRVMLIEKRTEHFDTVKDDPKFKNTGYSARLRHEIRENIKETDKLLK